MPMPRRSSGRYSPRSVSSSRTAPACGVTRPEITSSVVVFPEPLAPINPTMEPGSASNVTPLSAWTPPKCTVTPSTVRRAGCTDTGLSATAVTARPPRRASAGATGGPARRELTRPCAARMPTATRSPERCSSSASPPGRYRMNAISPSPLVMNWIVWLAPKSAGRPSR